MILTTVIVTTAYISKEISVEGLGPDSKPFNSEGMTIMLGFSVFSFEGIGIVMPIM
jgi:amino acid permease